MSFPNRVIFQQNQSAAQRQPTNNDYISGLHFYGTYPSGFSDATPTIAFLSLQQAVNAGITNTHIGETKATGGAFTITVPAAGTTIQVYIQEPFANVLIAKYTTVSGDTTATIGTGLINSMGALATGYTMSYASSALTIMPRAGLGAFLNTGTPISVTYSDNTTTITPTQFSDGASSQIDVWYYHISEYFRLMPNGKVFVTVTNTFSSSFNDIVNAQSFAQGQIRQFGVYTEQLYSESIVQGAKAKKTYLGSINQPAEIYLAMDLVGEHATWNGVSLTNGIPWAGPTSGTFDVDGTYFFSDVSYLPDMSGYNCAGIGVVVGQDGAAQGANLFYIYQHSITTLGATLGATSNAAVNIDIGWVQQYNVTDGTELNVPAFANGQLYSTVFSSENNALIQVDNYRYNFIMNYSGLVGTYFNDDKTATSPTDSFANMNDNRVIDKVQRVVYANLLPLVNGPIELASDGTIPPLTLANLDSLARNPMEQMARDGEIAGDANGNTAATAVQIDPNQNVVQQNGITITVQPTENGTARQILVPIGYAN